MAGFSSASSFSAKVMEIALRPAPQADTARMTPVSARTPGALHHFLLVPPDARTAALRRARPSKPDLRRTGATLQTSGRSRLDEAALVGEDDRLDPVPQI